MSRPFGVAISPGEWNELHRLGFPPKKTSVPAVPARAAGETERIVISGTVARDGSTGTLDSAFRMTSSKVPPVSDPTGDTCLRFFGAGSTSVDHCFAATFVQALPIGGFAVVAPYPAGTTRVALMRSGRELATLRAGTPPQVSIVSPAGGESWQGTQTIRWTASGPDAVFTVEYSPDGGTSWLPLSASVTGREFQFDTNDIVGGTDVRFRVIASAGIDTATATSASVRVIQNTRLTLDTTTVQFRNLPVGSTDIQAVTVSNTGTGQLVVRITAPASALFQVESVAGFILGPGESSVIRVTFRPTAAGSQQSTIRIGDQNVTLRGAAFSSASPSISVGAATFGHVQTGTNKDARVVLINQGLAALTVNSTAISGTGLSVVTTSPVTIQPGERTELVLRLTNAAAGTLSGVLTVNSTDPARAQVQVAVTATGVAGPVPATTAAGVLNAASFKGGAVAPGEIVTIFGTAIGPPALAGLQVTPQGKVATLVGETRVLFDGVAAPIVYVLAGQTSVVVPYSVAAARTTEMVVEYQGRRSDPVTLDVDLGAPGLFSATSTGSGQGAILNADFKVNGASNPADKGSAVVLFGTGEGSTNPAVEDGSVSAPPFPKPLGPVTATVGGIAAEVLYAGAAPGFVAGVLQVNLTIPANVPSGNQPVIVKIGNFSTQSGLTVAVR